MTVWRAIMLVLVSAAVAAFGLAWPQTRDKLWALCRGTDSHRAIAGCTALIEARQEGAATVADAFYSRGLAYETVGRAERGHDLALALFDRAIADADHAIDLKPDFVDAFILRGAIHVDKGAYDRAIADFDRALKLRPDLAEAFEGRGRAYGGKQDYVRAFQDFDQAIKLNPKNADAFQERGMAYVAKGEYHRAIEDLDQAIKLKPDDADAFFDRGYAYQQKSEYGRAIEDFDQVIKLDPKNAEAFTQRGFAYEQKSEYDRAIEDFDQAISLNPDDADAFFNRGLAYLHKGADDRAIADFDKVIKLKPDYANAFLIRGYAYLAKGADDRAIEDFDQVIKLRPDDAAAFLNRGYAYQQKSEHDRATEDFDHAISLTFTPLDPPRPAPELRFTERDGTPRRLADFRGRWVLVNLWATWCAPCVREMPSLDRLQAKLGERLTVLAISEDRGGAPVVDPSVEKLGLKALAVYLDPGASVEQSLGARGFPTSFLVDEQGRIQAQLVGPAEWDSPKMLATLERYLRSTKGGAVVKTSLTR